MKTRLQNFTRPTYIFSSPWLLAAAAGLLIMIVVTFAFHNLRLEQRLMTNAMLQKAATLMRVLHSGSRASYMNDLRKDYWSNDPWNVHVQRVVDHLAEDPELRFIAVVDAKGKIVAHSDQTRIGGFLSLPEGQERNEGTGEQSQMAFSIQATEEFGRVFETVRAFSTAFPAVMPMPMRPMREGKRGFLMHEKGDERPMMMRFFPEGNVAGEQHFVLVGLDMKEYDRTLGRLRMQIVMLSMAMLLVGLGGWFSLSLVQGFRISQKTLEDVQAFTSLLIAKLPVGVVATDATGRITTWNQTVIQLTGIPKNQVIGKKPAEVLPEALSAFFEATGEEGAEVPESSKEGSIRLAFGIRRCELLCHPLLITDSQQQYMGKVLLLSDVTKIRSLEQRMRENERLAAVGRMAGGVAHEVRNPLSSIKGLALLLKNKFAAGSKEQDTADLLIQETERMNRTITEMLSFTRPTALNLKPIDLGVLLQRSLQLIKAEAEDNHIEATLAVEPGLLPVAGDADRLQQVVMNILLNAMQAMEKGGKLAVTLGNREDNQRVELRIGDTGEGIAAELLPQVFYPYFTTKQGGTGIGLAISQKIIADHGGSIELESEPGQGTTVIILLPASCPIAPA
ncbi:MAG: PAS domain-containing protein [Desulfobulbaceae bacterium]|nr:PAS domain-containing protein [Desulfobulbaceae bacterium]